MKLARSPGDQEIVDQGAVRGNRLGPDARVRGLQVGGLNLRHQVLEGLYEGTLADRAMHLSHAHAKMFAEQAASPSVRKGFAEVFQVQVRFSVAFAGKGENGVGTTCNRTTDHPGNMHPEEGEIKVRHRIDQVLA